jgi:acyl dehydratase
MTQNRYFEDLSAGQRYPLGSVEVTEAGSLAFAREYDPQPMHIDAEAAARGRFKGLISSGWYTAALVMRLIAQSRFLGDTEVLGMAVEEIKWPMPVRPGDTLYAESEIVSMRSSQSNPGFGIVKFQITTRNQHGQVVMLHSPVCWVPRRPA